MNFPWNYSIIYILYILEEIFDNSRAMWFSKQGTKLAYAAFNETLVPLVYLPQYGIPDTIYDQYSRILNYRYPKVYISYKYSI